MLNPQRVNDEDRENVSAFKKITGMKRLFTLQER
jgi:hypothetical protein